MSCPPFSFEKVSTYFRIRHVSNWGLTVCGMVGKGVIIDMRLLAVVVFNHLNLS